MKIAIIGIRGVPARYGGLETCAEEVGSRLAARGHEVICYCRSTPEDDHLMEFKGIKRIVLPSLRYKITDTYSHSLLALGHAFRIKPDIILAFNAAIATLCIVPKIFGYKIVLNPNGFDWRRPKWGWFGKRFIFASSYMAAKMCDRLIIDAKSVCEYYIQDFKCDAVHIPNGANIDPESRNPEILQQYGLEKDGYFLFLSRLVVDNSCEYVIKAFEGLKTDKKLFMGGPSEAGDPYAEKLRETKDPRIIFPGPIYDPVHVKELHHGAIALIHGNQPGGTSLGLLKALGLGTCVMTLNTTDNAYVVQDSGLTYELSVDSLREKMQYVLDHPERVAELRKKAVERCREGYSWDHLTDEYEAVLIQAAGTR
ncbi:MAG TPA: glycosyltransferase [Candidatus Hydrogenedentes bacterium]|nr:glycosyltransferase [Candidatus Hydrogenedentota bacterium]